MLGLSESERNLADDSIDAKALWEYLQTRHGGAGPVQQVRLLQEALTTKCSPAEPITKTIDRIFKKINRAFDVGTVMKELLQSIAALSSLSNNSLYANARSIISCDLAAATAAAPYGPNDIRRFLENEQTLYTADWGMPDTQPAALVARSTGRGDLVCDACKAKGRGNYTGHTKPWCILDGGGMAGKTLDEAKAAHLAHYKAKREGRDKKKGSTKLTITPASGSAFTVEGDSDTLATYLATHASKMPTTVSKSEFAGLVSDTIPGHLETAEGMEIDAWIVLEEESVVGVDWKDYTPPTPTETTLSSATTMPDVYPFYLDSGMTVHISPDATDFTSLKPIPNKSIQGVGGSTVFATAIGQMKLQLANGSHLILDDALLVPKASVRLLSVSSMAMKNGIFTTFNNKNAMLFKGTTNKLIANGTLLPMKNLYSLNLCTESAFTVNSTPNIVTWHRRLGHVNYQTVIEMARTGMVEGMPHTFTTKPPKCNECILGKQTRTPVPKIREEGVGHQAMRKLGIVWVDLTGKQDITSQTGNNYIMNIVNDYINKPWSIPLKLKSDAFEELKAWILARQVETGLNVGILRSGNDSEIIAKDNELWFRSQGITTQRGAIYTSAHLGCVERMHRTLMGKSVAMRLYAQCPAFLWDEFYLTATHLHGKTRTSAMSNVTPDELWYDKKPNYSYIREIGCQVYVLVLGKHNPKIYERAIECTLIGYDPKAKAYRCYDKTSKWVYSTYHVRFVEHQDDYTSAKPTLPPVVPNHEEIPTIDAITAKAADQPYIIPDDDEEDITHNRDNRTELVNALLDIPADPVLQEQPAEPAQELPRRSARIPVPTARSRPDNILETPVERAVRESKDSAAWICKARADHQCALDELHHRENEQEQVPQIVEGENENLDQILTALNMTEHDLGIDAEDMDPGVPKTWNQAKESPDAERWKLAYKDELKSLKEMGVYRLIPRDKVPPGHRIHRG